MQETYSSSPAAAVAGMLYDSGAHDILSRYSAVAIPFGRFTAKAAGDGKIALPAASDDVLDGIAVRTQAIESGPAGDGVAPGYKATDTVNVLQKGRIWVYCETSFNPDSDDLYVRYTANGSAVPGQVRNDADSGKAGKLGATGYGVNHKVLNTLTGAGFLAIEIHLPALI